MSKKWLGLALASVLMVGALAGCGDKKDDASSDTSPSASTATVAPSDSASPSTEATKGPEIEGKVSASGSSALLPLVNLAREKFMANNPKVEINATAGGSGVGVKNVADGVSDIGNSDVVADAQYKDALVDHVVALAPFALIVSKDVTVTTLTKQQAADIFMGKIKNWKEVGGADAPINLVHRPDSSGSRKLVKQIILDGQDFSKDGTTQDSSKTVAEAIATGKGSIGYVDAPYVTDKVTALQLNGVAFSKDSIKDGTYPLYGIEHMYTKGEATGAVKAFIDYMTSSDFINSPEAEALGFLPADLIQK
ncbi:phosphate ABC transporter substrate-binding protein [Gorillibacterium massiliense]|uniref:phosphate ABC transporter substrate-binding protein n=1 Tax=Gorillibacterium massiliense TaxID=1280390 RepID=UPI0004BC87AE|nr:phosphate ABC transporter substrate-binding protein [Gorillibacterium massiliense]